MRRIFGQHVATSWVVFGVLEASLVAAGCYAAYYFVFPRPGLFAVGLLPFAMLLSLGIVAFMHANGLYQADAVIDFRRMLWRIVILTAPIFVLAVWTTGELAKRTSIPIYPYRWQWTAMLTGAWLVCAVILRLAYRQIYRRGLMTRRIVVVGTEDDAAQLNSLARNSNLRFQLVGRFDPDFRADATDSHVALSRAVSSLRASEIVITVGNDPLLWKMLAHCKVSGIRVTDYLDFCEREDQRIYIESLREEWIALSRGFETTGWSERPRRALDVLLSLAGFIATAPVLLLTSLAIKLEDGGPVLYRQERVGLNGRPFTLFKFRSMRQDAESDGVPAWAGERDVRVTTVGAVIRKLRIDELPQLSNVLRGEMALIGPRPERPYFVRRFSEAIPFYDYRHAVRPGITGWAQVSFRYGASVEDARRKLSYDLYYVKNRGILLDIVILLKTVGVVLRGEGAR
ncbi:MAG TPA: sugar transferase [Rhizomicrobium sp.]|jgi:sugar transferase (PEP-CTERM system associated)|nr:sugar transferase [Rhizomicrobium sp.]